ncbi:hypothetical protein [Streptomyces adelaidensis]|uniref:hypothetical protein n=1 Tax=Streptomyces adelaidensis TaxID=2796465 RepID=UPI0019043432|nr:hypothetical protein [Streptomyces adelaidensis]
MKTDDAPPPSQTPSSFGYCSWHGGSIRGVRLVRIPDDQGSGPAAPGLFACASCRHAYDLTPIADQP